MSVPASVPTRQTAKALRSLKLPAVCWSQQYHQYYARIGYRRSKSGTRQRAYYYFGSDFDAAVLQAAAKKAEWRDIRRKGGFCAVWGSHAISPSLARCTPEETVEIIKQYEQNVHKDEIEDGEIVQAQARLPIEIVRDMYLEYRKQKIGIGKGLGINERSYINECRDLRGGLACIDVKAPIDTLDDEKIERVVDDILRRVSPAAKNPIMERTANNYLRELRRMLDWAHYNKKIPYRHGEQAPLHLKRRYRNINTINIAEYDAEQLKTLLSTATDRQRLFVYLGLNCGYYDVDIGNLQRDQITTLGGQPVIVRRRSKTSHQNDFEALHTLWPETYELLTKLLAPNNKWGLALLSEVGTPMYRVKPHCNVIGDTYRALRKRSGVTLPFKQLRKLGATAIQRIGGDEARRLYKAGVIDHGDKVYVREAWQKLTPHLLAWGDELRRDGVLR